MTEQMVCPDPQQLAEFVEGKLEASGVADVSSHLRTCNDCLEEVKDGAEQHRTLLMFKRRQRVTWLSAAAAVMAFAAVSVGYWSQRDPVNELRSVRMKYRYVEPRLSGFPHADYQNNRGANDEPEGTDVLNLASAAYGLREKYEGTKTAKAEHAVGVSYLVGPLADKQLRDTSKAAGELAAAVRDAPNDPKIRNDYAAALYASQNQPEALKQVRIALQQKPDSQEALYNLALFIDRDDTQSTAAKTAAWQHYLQVDPTGPWAEEARTHLSDLTQP